MFQDLTSVQNTDSLGKTFSFLPCPLGSSGMQWLMHPWVTAGQLRADTPLAQPDCALAAHQPPPWPQLHISAAVQPALLFLLPNDA